MNAWRAFRNPVPAARVATPEDRAAVTALLASTWRRHGSGSIEDQAELLANGMSTVILAGQDATGFLGIDLRAPSADQSERWADMQLVALEVGRRGEGLLDLLVDTARPALIAAGCTGLMCLAPPGWLSDELSKVHFRLEDQVVTYARNHGAEKALPFDLETAHLWPAGAGDAPIILTLNTLAFAPIWRYDDATIMGWLMTADRTVVAEIDGRPAGFALTAQGLSGNYAHLIRVATHPAFRGLGLGRHLVVDAIRHADRIGAPGIALNTQASNRVSRNLYESLGFRSTGYALNVFVSRF